MQPSSFRNQRSPLRAVTNTADVPLTKNAGSTPVKNALRNPNKVSSSRMSMPLPPSDSKDKGPDKQKKARSSLNKRVSFGGNSINVFYKQSDFSPQDSEPPVKAPRTTSRSSPLPQRSPRFKQPDSRVLPMDSGGKSDDRLSIPSVHNVPEDSYLPDRNPSPPVDENLSPVATRRDSMGFTDRRSFGVFIDEDVTMGERDVITDDQEDITMDLPRFHSVAKARRASNTSVLSDGDITQTLYNRLPQLLADEYLGDENESTDDANGRPSPPNLVDGDGEEEFTAKTHSLALQEGPERANDSSDVALAQPDEGVVNSSNDGRSELDVPLAEQERNQKHSVAHISSSPGLDNPNDSSACPSPTVPVSVRPVPPNRRKLFDGDGNEDEDNTLHYHEEPGRSIEVPGITKSKPLEVMSDLPTTPLSATQSKLRSAMEERESASGKRDAATKLRELSSSAMRSSQPDIAVSQSDGSPEKRFKFRDFLQAVQLNFDRKAETRHRGQSLGPQNNPSDIFDHSSTKGEILESIRKISVFETFSHQIETLQAKIAQDKHNLEILDHQIESTRPPLFSKMAELETMPIHETTTYRVSMKRIRKLSTLKNKEEWVTCRQMWEKALGEQLKAAITALGQDSVTLTESGEECGVTNSLFVEQVAGLGTGPVFTDATPSKDSTQEDNNERAAFIQEMSKCRDIKGYLDSLKHEKDDLAVRRESAAPLQSSLLSTCAKLRKNANANNEGSMRKMITEEEELNSIVSGFSGVNLTRVNKNSISLRVLDMMDIQFSLHDEKVINTSCKTVCPFNDVSRPPWQSYMDGAVSLVNWDGGVKNVKYMRDIPGSLYRCTSALRQVRLVYEDAEFFLDRNMGRIVYGGFKRDEEAPCLDLTVEASFYSLALRSKFDVTVTVTTRLPSTDSSAHLVQQATVDKIHRYFGDKPEDKVISNVLIDSGRRDLGMYSLADGLAGVRRSLC